MASITTRGPTATDGARQVFGANFCLAWSTFSTRVTGQLGSHVSCFQTILQDLQDTVINFLQTSDLESLSPEKPDICLQKPSRVWDVVRRHVAVRASLWANAIFIWSEAEVEDSFPFRGFQCHLVRRPATGGAPMQRWAQGISRPPCLERWRHWTLPLVTFWIMNMLFLLFLRRGPEQLPRPNMS